MKKLKILAVFTVLIYILAVPALAYEDNYPSNAPFQGGIYLHCQTNLGNSIIYIPIEYREHISTYRGTDTPVNIGNATINCNLYTGSGLNNYYQCRISRNNQFEYYWNYSGSNWRWDPLTVSRIDNTNLKIIDNYGVTAIRQIPIDEMIPLLILCVLIILAVIVLINRRQ